jgi:hypothetical protein
VLRSIVLSERKIGIPGHEPKRADGRDGLGMSTSRSGPTERKIGRRGPVPSLKFRGWFGEFLRAGERELLRKPPRNFSGTVKMPLEVLRQLEFLPGSQELSRNHSKTPQERLL